ncbi:MAG: hypothetical protein M3Y48_10540 [Actinomycetota bacterium]|nr:hypothetical protein [Actinomycetota bacterium]
MSVPAPPYGSFAPRPGPLRNGIGVVSFALGLMVAFGLVAYAAWLAIAAMGVVGTATQHVAGSIIGRAPVEHYSVGQDATIPRATLPAAATPNGTTMAFDQLWTAPDGNTIVAGAPTVGTSPETGESVILVPVTLTNNGERDWNPVSTSFVGAVNRATVPESAEGDWMYRSPIVPHTSVTLTKEFVGGRGQFTLTASSPNGVALFSGHV